jgi:methionine aminopeptidase
LKTDFSVTTVAGRLTTLRTGRKIRNSTVSTHATISSRSLETWNLSLRWKHGKKVSKMIKEEFMKLAVSKGYDLKTVRNYCKHKSDKYTYTENDFIALQQIKSTANIIRRLIMNDCIKERNACMRKEK